MPDWVQHTAPSAPHIAMTRMLRQAGVDIDDFDTEPLAGASGGAALGTSH